MPSFTTVYRAIVMVAAGVIVVKGWQLYGPTTEQVKSFGVRSIEMANVAWNNLLPTGPESTAAVADPRLSAATAPAPATATAPTSVIEPAPLLSVPGGEVGDAAAGVAATDAVVAPATEDFKAALLPAGVTDRLPPLLSRLEELGATDPQLAPWGSSGEIYRFCCRATLADTPGFSRHFEAVAAEPLSAVEQVVAKVEAWRATQRDGVAIR